MSKLPPIDSSFKWGYILTGISAALLIIAFGFLGFHVIEDTSSNGEEPTQNGIDNEDTGETGVVDITREEADVEVTIDEYNFQQHDLSEGVLEAEVGDKIHFYNDGNMMHTVTIPELGIDEQVEAGEGIAIQVNEPVEDILVDCTLHQGHEAELTVEDDSQESNETHEHENENTNNNNQEETNSNTEMASLDVDEISRHPTDMPESPNYMTYANGTYEDYEEREDGETRNVEIHSTFEEVNAEVVDGTSMEYWTFDGKVPGPLFRVKEGDTIEWNLHNPEDNAHPHNIAVHGVSGPGGGALHTDVASDGTAELDTEMLDPGVYIYHCAFPAISDHIAMGMNGIIVVEPEEGLPEVDHEFQVLQMDFYTEEGGDQYAADLENQGHLEYSREHLAKEEPSFVTFNGRPEAIEGDRALGEYENEIEPEDDIRVFFGNGGPALASSYRGAVGDQMDHYGGDFELIEENEETVLVPAGAAKMFELSFDVPGMYPMYDHSFPRPDKGARAEWSIAGDLNDYDDIYNPRSFDDDLR